MALEPKILADGQLASSKGTIYTVPDNTSTLVSSLIISNTNATSQTIIIYLKPGSTSRQVAYVAGIAQNEGFILTNLQLEAGDLIEAETTTATAVDFIIMGNEKT